MRVVNAGLLLLADSRVPAGGHVHSGGVEAAWRAGLVTDVGSLRAFLVGRLATSGRVAAAFAAEAARLAAGMGWSPVESADAPQGESGGRVTRPLDGQHAVWELLDEEFDARTPSAAQRAASRQQGRGLVRAYPGVAAELGPRPHHPIAFGALAAVSGAAPEEAATAIALASVTAPASAALRLLALDPFAVHRVLTEIASIVDDVARAAARRGELPDDCAPLLDVLAEAHHHHEEGQLFVS
ncbi:urease accessory protein UreF [Allokutzneria oryzae]|uniref:Urease accessory protein UreF n=1 Tax=Allokutzneria oryzae TaxID=1378989 RepID=A0ABV5ZPB2_9PSEU